MKALLDSLVACVNVTGTDIVLGDVTLVTGVPGMVYRNASIFGDEDSYNEMLSCLGTGAVRGYNFSNQELDPIAAQGLVYDLINEVAGSRKEKTYAEDYSWFEVSALRIRDGLKRQIDLFDWDAETVTLKQWDSLGRHSISAVFSYLSSGYLDIALLGLLDITPDGDDEFFSAATLGTFTALVQSAITPIPD